MFCTAVIVFGMIHVINICWFIC